ncbi:hypothetical protein EMK97_16215 [Litorilituus sediminis]|uniref:Uncharacterized protein n=1 Tax=Litorilituus sediminis TaxID=718192 RepID=A0A4V0ZGM9_9GAMM|nr:hypothetical protein EMK97_16215 [Litorilituus sediminis]
MHSPYKLATLFAVFGMLIGIAAFMFNYYLIPVTLPGYEILLAPAMLALSFFSEETYFTPKMIILLSGQFVGYFIVAFTFLAIKK